MTQNIQQNNPLQHYFRTPKLYLKLPSGTTYYDPKDIEFTSSGEIGILAMTGMDEVLLKNPDGLLNGESLIEVIKSCIPAVKNPRILLANDIDALITAIRYATYNDSLETTGVCPKCSHENTYKLNLQYALDNMNYLEDEYVINLSNGLSIFVRPHSFPDIIKVMGSDFDRAKIAKSINDENLEDAERSAMFKKAFANLATTKFDLLVSGVIKIVDESRDVNVSDRKFIREFLVNTEKKDLDKINDLIEKINKIGVKKSFQAKCEKCEHTWDCEIDFNPVNFSSGL